MEKRTIFEIILIATIVALICRDIWRPKPQPEIKPYPVIIDRTDSIRIEKIKTFINNETIYTHEREIIYKADSVQLDSILDAQLREIAKRGW